SVRMGRIGRDGYARRWAVAQLAVDDDLLRRRRGELGDLVAEQQLEAGLRADLADADAWLQREQPHPAAGRLEVEQGQVGDHGPEPTGEQPGPGPAVPAGQVAGAGDEVDPFH